MQNGPEERILRAMVNLGEEPRLDSYMVADVAESRRVQSSNIPGI
jgi:hypothetical protein